MSKKKEQTNQTINTELSMPQRFTNAVIKSYGDVAKDVPISSKQMKLISNYYIKICDTIVGQQGSKIQNWNQVRLPELATTLAHMAKLNLDMSLGHLSFMPFEYKNTNTFNLSPVISSSGYEYIAKTYGIEPHKQATIELVYDKDNFTITKKDSFHPCDSYTFEITNPFNRGEIIGGFGYLEFEDTSKNFILAMSVEDILKYKPKFAKDLFWSGENRKKMYEKTIAKQLFKRIKLDPDKVNSIQDSFDKIETEELNYTAMEAKNEIDENMCSGEVVDIDFKEISNIGNDVENLLDEVEQVNILGEIKEMER